MKKLFGNKYFLYIVIVAVGAYILYYLSKGKKSNVYNYQSYFDDVVNISNNDLVDEEFCQSPEIQNLGGIYVWSCQFAIGQCSKINYVQELQYWNETQISGDPYSCSACCVDITGMNFN